MIPYFLLKAASREKKKPGPTAGLTEDPAVFLARHGDIAELLRAGKSLRCIQKATGKARNTVLKVKRMTQ